MKKYRHLFFDLDHTLWDFNVNSVNTLAEIFEKFSLQKKLEVSFTRFMSVYQEINEQLWDKYRNGKIAKDDLRFVRFFDALAYFGFRNKELAISIGEYYVYHSPRKSSLLPNAIQTLDYLKERYNMHIITNGFEEVQYIKLKNSLLDNYFEHIITSERAGAKKPSELVFNYALELTNCSVKECLMIGDSFEADIVGASNVGMDQVYFCEKKRWKGGKATYQISNLIELVNLL